MKKFVNNTNSVITRIFEENPRVIHKKNWMALKLASPIRAMTSVCRLLFLITSSPELRSNSKATYLFWVPDKTRVTGLVSLEENR